MEIVDYVAEMSGEYARLLLLADMARDKAVQLGETGMADALHLIVHDASERLAELSNEEAARRIATAE